jgi:sarcosine oxidase
VTRTDLLVVGGGAMGSATAWWAARAGRSVTLLERHPGHHVHGSSHGRSRIFRLAYRDAPYVALAREAYGLWRRLEAESATPLLDVTGGVDHGSPADVAAVAEHLGAAGVPFSRLSPTEAAARWPGLRFDGDVVLQPDAGRLDADAVVTTLHAEAARHGADVRFSCAAVGARPTPYGLVVSTTSGDVEARVVVVAAGAWLPGLLPSLPVPDDLPPLRVTQEQPVYFRCAPDVSWPSFIHWRPVPVYGLAAPGDGVKAGEHGSGRVVDPDARLPADRDAVARMEAYAAAWLPGAEPVAARVDSCLYTSTPDESFVLRRNGPLVVCSPCSGHGFKFVPAIGRRTAELSG